MELLLYEIVIFLPTNRDRNVRPLDRVFLGGRSILVHKYRLVVPAQDEALVLELRDDWFRLLRAQGEQVFQLTTANLQRVHNVKNLLYYYYRSAK